jgi:hypothetical protein
VTAVAAVTAEAPICLLQQPCFLYCRSYVRK